MSTIAVLPISPQMHRSADDTSINWVFPKKIGYFEARYVRRDPRYLVVYLSVQSGCDQSCRMCHLTATKQVNLINATLKDLLLQAETVLDWYVKNEPKAKVVHFNFMARGEPMNSTSVLRTPNKLFLKLAHLAKSHGLLPRYLISTILPQSFRGQSLVDTFDVFQPEIYYSLYSMDPAFRKRWVPKALPAEEGLLLLKEWQDHSAKIPKIHYAFIEGQNDAPKDVQRVCEALNDIGLRVDVNIVRYNPFSDRHGREPPELVLVRNKKIFEELLPQSTVQIIARVGHDVNAACGMFTT